MNAPPSPADAPLCWRSWPVVDDYPRSLLLVGTIVAVSVGVGFSFEGAGWGVISCALLVVSVLRYLVPTHYAIGAAGVEARTIGGVQRRAWSEIRATYPHRDGVHLSPFSRPSPLDPFRGLFVRFAGNRDAVLAAIDARVPPVPPATPGAPPPAG